MDRMTSFKMADETSRNLAVFWVLSYVLAKYRYKIYSQQLILIAEKQSGNVIYKYRPFCSSFNASAVWLCGINNVNPST